MAEVVSKSLEHNNADDLLFDYFTSLVGTISSSENLGAFPLDFLLGYAQYLGIYPEDGESNEFIKMIGAEDKDLSRRVEFRVRTNAEKKLEEIANSDFLKK